MAISVKTNSSGINVNIIKGATQADLTNAANNAKTYRDEAQAFSIVSEDKSIESAYSALNASVSATTASDKATIATTKANEASNSAINASASEAVCIAKATIATDNADIAIAQAVIATNKATEANTSANTANTQANIAITKSSEASTSASNALTSENNADTSEANALTYRNQAESFANSINPSDLVHISGTETITGNKTFSGTVSGLTKATVGLNNVDNTSDSSKSVNYATTAGTASASDVHSWAKEVSKPSYTASEIGLGNVTNESKTTMFTSPTFTGTVTLPSTTSIGTISSAELGYIDGVTSNIQNQLDSKNPNLVSGTNIKTINGSTILESGNINLVDLTTNQSINGIKTFSSSPIVPTPTAGTQAVNKDYVDTKQARNEVAYSIDTSSFIQNTLASGAIIERGSNANGEYVKFADGTLICNAWLPDEEGYSWPLGTWLKSSNFPLKSNGWTYPSAFSAAPSVHISCLSDNGISGDIEGILSAFYSTSATKAFFDGKATTNITRILFINVMAIGRWK